MCELKVQGFLIEMIKVGSTNIGFVERYLNVTNSLKLYDKNWTYSNAFTEKTRERRPALANLITVFPISRILLCKCVCLAAKSQS